MPVVYASVRYDRRTTKGFGVTKIMGVPANEIAHVSAVWFGLWLGDEWLGMLYRRPDGVWQFAYRFNHHTADVPSNRRDVGRTRVEEFVTNAVARTAIEGIIANMVADQGTVERVEVNGSAEDAVRAMLAHPWAYIAATAPEASA